MRRWPPGYARELLLRNAPREPAPEGFRHEALLYAGEADFVDRTVSFIRDGLASAEPILVVVGPEKIDALRDELGTQAGDVRFADMLDVGSNPARIIPAWQSFVDDHGGSDRPVRGIGEPSGRRGPRTSSSSASGTRRC